MLAKNKTNKKFIFALLIALILLPSVLFLTPKKVSADCTWANTPGTPCYISSTPVDPLLHAAGHIDAASASTAKSSFWSQVWNGTTQAKTSISAGLDLKQWALEVAKQALRVLAKEFLKKMTESTVNWINTGFHGSPLFVEHPDSFFGDIAKFEIKNLVSQVGYNTNGNPFAKSFLINIINGYKRTFAQNAQFSLSKVTNDPELLQGFRRDFKVGGWDGFLLNTQSPQNNYVGSQIMYSAQLTSQLQGTDEYSTAAQKIQKELSQAGGFLSPKKCVTNPNFNNDITNEFHQPTFKCDVNTDTLYARCDAMPDVTNEEQDAKNQCVTDADTAYQSLCLAQRIDFEKSDQFCPTVNGKSGFITTTPGAVVSDQIMTALNIPAQEGSLGAAMGNSLSAIFDSLLNQLLKTGLNSLKSKPRTATPADTFNYYGNTLNSTTTGTGSNFDWNQSGDPRVKCASLNPNLPLGCTPNIDNLPAYDGSKFIDGPNPSSVCPEGQTGTPPNCVAPNVCPDGTSNCANPAQTTN